MTAALIVTPPTRKVTTARARELLGTHAEHMSDMTLAELVSGLYSLAGPVVRSITKKQEGCYEME